MRVTITVECDNDAFIDPETEKVDWYSVAYMVVKGSEAVRDYGDRIDRIFLRDANGNTVGHVTVEG